MQRLFSFKRSFKTKLILLFFCLLTYLLTTYNIYWDAGTVAQVSETYKITHGRERPEGFEEWVKFAQTRQCLLDLKYYDQIYKDLEPWMHGRSIREDLQNLRDLAIKKDFEDLSDLVMEEDIEKFRLKIVYKEKNGPFNSELLGGLKLNRIAPQLRHIARLIKYDFKFLLNQLDEPFSLPADNDTSPYHSVEDTIQRNSCLRNVSTSIRDSHGYFLGSETLVSFNGLVPVFSQAKHPCFMDIMVPLSFHTTLANQAVNDPFPWHKKKNVLFWRGSTTGGSYRKEKPWKKYHRTRLIDWAKNWTEKYPDSVFDAGLLSDSLEEIDFTSSRILVDIGFSAYVQSDHITTQTLQSSYPVKKYVSFEKALNFKYLLVVDGNTWPSRIQNYLKTNSVILYSGIFIDYYLSYLEPWVHYVPVRTDLADLEEKIDWLLANDDMANKIAQNAKTLMVKLGSKEQMECYTGLLMQEYGRLYAKSKV
jgi:hypothetical protein